MSSFENVPAITGSDMNERMQDAVANGYALQQVKTGYATAVAVQKPRSLSKMVAAVLSEAEQAGASFYYRWEAGGKEIVGGSIDMAASIFRAYGNCAMEIGCNETPSHYFFTATFIDLESGMSWPRMFRQRKSQSVSKKMEQDRQEDIVFQIGQSKAMRNAVLSVMPRWIVDKAVEKARSAEIQRLSGKENIELARAEVLKYFGRFGVSKERLEAKIGRAIEDTGPEDLADLRSTATAIKDGLTTISEAFPVQEREAKQETPPPATPKPAGIAAAVPPAPPQPAPPPPAPAPQRPEPEPPVPNPEPAGAGGLPFGNTEPPKQTGFEIYQNPFDNRDAWKNFRTKSDGLSTYYFRNRKLWDAASAESKRAFFDKWQKCYGPDGGVFPGAMPVGSVPGETSVDPVRDVGDEAFVRAPDRATRIEMFSETFEAETMRAAKQAMGFGTGDGTWPSTDEGLSRLWHKCREIEPF